LKKLRNYVKKFSWNKDWVRQSSGRALSIREGKRRKERTGNVPMPF
jgi:hypothetical protein